MKDKKTQKTIIRDFLKRHTLAVLSVSRDGQPQSAVLQFSETEDLEILFDTFSTYRKYETLKDNPRASVVVGWDDDVTVQYEGLAQELSGKELERCKTIHLRKLPDSVKFASMDVIKYFKITPTWIRYSDLSKDPWEVFEITL